MTFISCKYVITQYKVEQYQILSDILDSGSIAHGFNTGVWTCPMVARVIEEEFSVSYHPTYVSKILHKLKFSVQRSQKYWLRLMPHFNHVWYIINIHTLKKAKIKNAITLFKDEVSFRQDPTLYQTWARVGSQPKIPTMGLRNTLKVFGTIDLYYGRFLYHFQKVFNTNTYMEYLEPNLMSLFSRKDFSYTGQCCISQREESVEMVFSTTQISRSLQFSHIFSRIQCHGKNLASYTIAWNAQPLFFNTAGFTFNFYLDIQKHSKESNANHELSQLFNLNT